MFARRMKAVILALALFTTGGCLAAAGAGLGAGIYLSDRGAESIVASPVDRTYAAAQQAFREMGISEERTVSEPSERQLEGKRGDKNIKVTLKPEGSSTRVEVVASEDMVVWDKELARDVLERIVKISQ